MNFYGHAVLAAEQNDHPRFVLGAMLPDLAGMARLRLPTLAQVELRDGVAHHHLVDSYFHAAPQFIELVSTALAELCNRGLGRGPARAVAHVGVELLLDGYIHRTAGTIAIYENALQAVAKCTELHDAEAAPTLAQLSQRLQRAPIPEGYESPQFVAERLAYMLQTRPRLRLATNDLPIVVDILKTVQRDLETRAESLLAHVRSHCVDTE